jgi:hypothetical protein
MIWVLVIGVVVAILVPAISGSPLPDEQNNEEPDTLLANLASNSEDSKPFNLQGIQSGRRSHGIYFNGR